jgi:hypothetical protein
VETPLHRPPATARRLLTGAQAGAAAAVLGLALVVGALVQAHLDARPDRPAVLVEVPGGVIAGEPSEHVGALAGIGVVIVGWTLVGCAGTVGAAGSTTATATAGSAAGPRSSRAGAGASSSSVSSRGARAARCCPR